jgi:hypothetical protein
MIRILAGLLAAAYIFYRTIMAFLEERRDEKHKSDL